MKRQIRSRICLFSQTHINAGGQIDPVNRVSTYVGARNVGESRDIAGQSTIGEIGRNKVVEPTKDRSRRQIKYGSNRSHAKDFSKLWNGSVTSLSR